VHVPARKIRSRAGVTPQVPVAATIDAAVQAPTAAEPVG